MQRVGAARIWFFLVAFLAARAVAQSPVLLADWQTGSGATSGNSYQLRFYDDTVQLQRPTYFRDALLALPGGALEKINGRPWTWNSTATDGVHTLFLNQETGLDSNRTRAFAFTLRNGKQTSVLVVWAEATGLQQALLPDVGEIRRLEFSAVFNRLAAEYIPERTPSYFMITVTAPQARRVFVVRTAVEHDKWKRASVVSDAVEIPASCVDGGETLAFYLDRDRPSFVALQTAARPAVLGVDFATKTVAPISSLQSCAEKIAGPLLPEDRLEQPTFSQTPPPGCCGNFCPRCPYGRFHRLQRTGSPH